MGSKMRPNIVFILADDMGYGDFSAFNNGLSETPTLDALMQESLCLTQQYTASPVCNPSRAALLTGRYPHRTGSIDTLEWWGLERLALSEVTLADVLKTAGYTTGLVGKWHLGAFDKRYHPTRRGFDEAVCFRGGMHDYYHWRLEFNDSVQRSDRRYLTDVFTEEAVQFIERHQKEPFFLHVTFNAPHTPLQAPQEEIRPFEESGKFNKGVSTIYAMIHRMDRGIGRILETLKKCGLEDNTIVLFTSDNGPAFGGEGDACTTRFNCNYNGAKGTVYEGGVRVPMLLRWRAGLDAPREVPEMVHFCDWFPTLLSAVEVDIPRDLKLDGVNVFPVLKGESRKVETRRFWQWNRYTPLVTCNAAMRDGEWKLVRPAIREAMQLPDGYNCEISMYNPEHFIVNGIFKPPYPPRDVPPPPSPELYNIEEDPLERNNLAEKYPSRAQKMLHELETWFEEVDAERRRNIDNETQ
ncbi:sulfatase-like hydrolase/transferase [candidate division KSB1 bacterium]|nr:sulfatase-like hydrolase/transferase [candidate division KSB1 bacterium]